ncbi:unnamed protein product [Cladocopium goreaui]|uniref:Protein NRT1/ PTR FAMILY 8.5 (AtNPF8.5) (Peptide transporter PTR6) n=1 Tax=Cladocopium goreaui TaxID=2562237 RepID=A0A9P1D1I6_9DINO|nr:unnamed protein product [Cladocopium goreaui]
MSINMGVLVSYGFLTTLCSSGLPGLIPPSFGYATAYFLAAMAMVVALTVFLCFSSSYRCLDRHVGNAIRGVVLHVVSAAVEGSWRATAICIGWPLLLLGLLLSVCISLIPASAGLGLFGALSVLGGLLLATYGCGELSWVQSAAQRNSHVTRQQTADFLRIMPTLAAVNLAFNSVYNCMAFWFQEQACLMDVRLGPLQLNGSFFNVADGLAIVVFTHPLMNHLNPWLERRFGLRRHGKVLLGCALAAVSVLWAIQLEEQRQRAPLLDEVSLCAPDGMKMSSLSAWWMVGPYTVMGVAEVYVNPTLYYLAYSQSPLRLRSSAQALGLLMSATSSALFTILTAILGGKDSDSLQVGYFLSLTMMIPFICWYLCVQSSWEERHFDEESEAEVQPGQLNKGVAFSRTGMLRDFASPQSIGGSPASWVDHSPSAAECCRADDVVYQIVDPEDFVLQGLPPCGGIVSDHEDVRSGKVLAVAKHPTDHRMDYWLKVEYGDSKIAFVHMLMSCGWTSNKLMLDVGDVAFPPGQQATEGSSVPLPDLDPGNYDQEFVVPSHLEAIETNAKLKSVFPEASRGQVKSVWRHNDRFWLEVTSEGTCYGAHFIEAEEGSEVYYLTCAVKLPEDEDFPPAPLTTRGEAEFVVPSHLEAIETNAKLKSVFPEASRGQVKSVWRHNDRFWLEVTSEGTCYGAHFIEAEEGSEVYYLTCAVKLPEDEDFPLSGLGPIASDEDLLVIDTPLPVEEPAAEPAPTDVEEDTSTSMGEKLRQAVLSGSQDDLKRLFQQCSKLPAKKAAFDDLLKPQEAVQPAGAPAQPADVSAMTRLEPAVQEVAGGPSSPSRAASGPEMFFIGDDSMAEDLIGGASAPSAPSSQPSYAQAAPAPAPAALTPELVQQLHSNGVSANNLTPHQLERMSPQELVQLQAMISSALQDPLLNPYEILLNRHDTSDSSPKKTAPQR